MILIDKDALIQKVKEEEQKRNLDKEDASLLQLFIECYAEPVDAIPTEWVEKYIWSADTHEEKRALRKMYIQWEKENE